MNESEIIFPETISPVKFSDKDLARFWSKVGDHSDPEACWLWTAGRDKKGYGRFGVGSVTYLSSRISWMIHHGLIANGLLVCHDCPGGDNPSCINPNHLWLGTPLENSQDMVAKGRSTLGDRSGSRKHPDLVPQGSQRGNVKLSEADVLEIRRLYIPRKVTLQMLAAQFKSSQAVLSTIINRKAWKHVL